MITPSESASQSAPPGLTVEVDGRPATADDLRLRALDSYGHFTALQVRDGRTRGLAHHLARLDAATRELFGTGLDGARVREVLRHALGGVRAASARVHVHRPADAPEPTLMVTVAPPVAPAARPQGLMSVPYQRPVPHIKHLGGFAQIHYRRLAGRAGFDDALLVDAAGVVSESAIANIAFWDGTSLVWPDAPALTGITMALLEPLLPAAGIPCVRREVTLAGLGSYRAAFLTNSHGIAPVGRIDGTVLPGDEALSRRVSEVYEGVAWDVI
ncbi:aminotransferase class IV [Streptomyces sp. NPDC093085]|uniref:aminotransferase class IV n=1 Tax=Streptomyces sp. NPDC093085 TaxID=3155068 RepID=UPI0034383B28